MSQLVLPHTIDAGTAIVANEHQLNYEAIRDVINGNLEGGGGVSSNFKADGVTARELVDELLLRGLPSRGVVQEGVFLSTDLAVSPGAGLTLNYASGLAHITDDSGLVATGALIPAYVAVGGSVTPATNSSGNPRFDQVILTLTGYNTGTVSVLQGTPNAAATLANRTGAAALPVGTIRLKDVLVPNGFAGPFVEGTHIRDRRLFSRGFSQVYEPRPATVVGASASYQAFLSTHLTRVEAGPSSKVITFLSTRATHNAAGGRAGFRLGLSIDGANPTSVQGEILTPQAANDDIAIDYVGISDISEGTHTIQPVFLNPDPVSYLHQFNIGFSFEWTQGVLNNGAV